MKKLSKITFCCLLLGKTIDIEDFYTEICKNI